MMSSTACCRSADPVVVFDDDHYYLGGVLAEKLWREGLAVTLVTPADRVSAWTANTLEQHAIQKRLLELGVTVVTNHNIVEFDGERTMLECVFTGRRAPIAAFHGHRHLAGAERRTRIVSAGGFHVLAAAGIRSSSHRRLLVPSTIAAAVYAGHRHAREFDWPQTDEVGFRRE